MIMDCIVVEGELVKTEGKLFVEGSKYCIIHYELRGSECLIH